MEKGKDALNVIFDSLSHINCAADDLKLLANAAYLLGLDKLGSDLISIKADLNIQATNIRKSVGELTDIYQGRFKYSGYEY